MKQNAPKISRLATHFFRNYKNPFKSKSLPLVECMTVTSEVRNWKSLNLKNLWSVEVSRSEDGKSRFSDTRHLTNAFQPRIGFRLALGRSQDTCIPIKELTQHQHQQKHFPFFIYFFHRILEQDWKGSNNKQNNRQRFNLKFERRRFGPSKS